MSYNDHEWQKKEKIKIIIEHALKEDLCLQDIFLKVEEECNCKLSNIDLSYVEDTYIDLVVPLWIEEETENTLACFQGELNQDLDSKSYPLLISKFIETLNKTTTFEDCFNNLNDSMFIVKLLELLESSKKLEREERNIVNRFKHKCLKEVKILTKNIENELNFLNNFVEQLKLSKNLDDLDKILKLKLFITNNNPCSFKTFLTNLEQINDFNKSTLKLSGRKLLNQKDVFLVQNVKHLADSYLKPVTLTNSVVDGRRVLEVEGKHIVTSTILKEIENHSSFLEIEEVRFIKAGVVHIDADFQNSVWHGKNIVVVADTIIISIDKQVVWDVSGKDAEDTVNVREPAGTAADGWGLPGAHGSHAESGGNVCILTDTAENLENLTIISNGGRGGKGQDGGKGTNGASGNYIDYYSFLKDFPAVAKYLDSKKLERLQTTMKNITKDLQSVEKLCFGSTELQSPISNSDFKRVCNFKTIKDLKNIYFKVETTKNNKITFSFFNESFSICQALLLHEGSEGEEGNPGGPGGLGGKGGFPGDVYIEVAATIIETKPADGIKDGADGSPGARGNPGKSGVDRGYVDRTLYLSKLWPIMYSPDSSQRLTVKLDEEEGTSRVWYPFHNRYAEIVTVEEKYKIQQTLPCKAINNISEQRALSVTASRKRTICPRTIRNKYQENSSVLDVYKITKSLDQYLEKVEGLLNGPAVQSEQLTTELKTTKQIHFCLDDMTSEEPIIEASSVLESTSNIPTNTMSVAEMIDIINFDKNSAECSLHTASWTIKSQLDCESLTKLWNEILKFVQQDSSTNKTLTVLFINKYKLLVLQHIGKSLSFLNLSSDGSKTKHSLCDTRILSKVNNRSSIVDEVEKYFVEDSDLNRSKIIELCKTMTSDGLHTLTRSIVLFLEDFGVDDGQRNLDVCNSTRSILKAFSGHYQEFLRLNKQILEERLIPVSKDLEKRSNNVILNVLIRSILDNNNECKITFEEMIQKDSFLSNIIKCYAKKIKQQEFGWKDFFKNSPVTKKAIETEFHNYLRETGPYSASYRELLALHYKTNIFVYSNCENDTLILTDNHNPKAVKSVHLLVQEDLTNQNQKKFIKLNYDEDLAKVVKEHEKRGSFLNKVMANVDLLDNKMDLDELLSKKDYLSKAYKGVHHSEAVKVKISHKLSQEHNIKVIANSFNSTEDIQMVTCRLEKLKSEFLGHENILHYMALHFSTEEKHLSAKELSFTLNVILKFALEESQAMPLVSWICSAFVQTEWLAELALLQLEYTLKQTLSDELTNKWRKYLSDVKEQESLMFLVEKLDNQSSQMSVKSVDEILNLFSNIPSAHVGLMYITPLEWKYHLKDKYWAQKLLYISPWTGEQLKVLSYYILTLENTCGKELCDNIMALLGEKKYYIESENDRIIVLDTIKSLASKEVEVSEEMLTALSSCEIYHWQDCIEQSLSQDQGRSLKKLVQLIKSSGNTSKGINDSLEEIENKVKCCNKLVNFVNIIKTKCDSMPEESQKLLNSRDKIEAERVLLSIDCDIVISENTLKDILQKLVELEASATALVPLVIKVIEIKLGITLRNTQRLAIMIMLENKHNVLAQVSTGEGKSLIVVVLAVLSAMSKQKVNIVTSSKVLAVRDAELYKKVYSFCGVSVGHNCSEDIEERKASYSNCQVIYGELGHFQRDFLLDRVYGKNILGNCTFEVVFVDEVDSMVLDKCNNVLYLSHDIPWMDELELIFVCIWNLINTPTAFDSDFSISSLKNKLLFHIFGLIKIENIRDLDRNMSEKQVQSTWNDLVGKNIIDNEGVLVMQNMQDIKNAINSISVATFCLKDHLIYMFDKIVYREQTIHVPNFLRVFVKNHLEEWIMSAFTALSMDIERDYVIDVDRTGTASDRSPNIVILDRDTGSDLVNSQWERGLHQFLQLKHGTKLSLVSLKAIFISNKSYLKLYQKLYGLTGTLGSKKERDLLKESYETDFVTVPTAKRKCFSEEFPLLCSNTEEWSTEICKKATQIAKSRSVLIICASVNDVIYLKGQFPPGQQVSTYTRDYEIFNVGMNLEPGHIIVATNLAGRGTDIKLSQRLVEANGLHVCLTFMPSNCRVEEQAFGRVARNGEPGSGQMIFISKLSHKHSISKVIDLKNQRDMKEKKRLAEIQTFYETNIHSEEQWCNKFEEVYKKLQIEIKQDEDIKLIFLQYCLNQWAFWLEESSKLVISEPNSVELQNSFEKYESMCEKLCNKDFNVSVKQVTEPSLLIKLGVALMKKKDYSTAILLFDRVIDEEPNFTESALYYRVCAKCEVESLKMADITSDLEKVAQLFNTRMLLPLLSASLIDRLKEQYHKSFLQIEGFKEQQMNLGQLYNIYLQSVYKIIGCEITPEKFIIPTVIDEETADTLFVGFVEKGLIRKPKIKAHIEAKELSFVSEYGLIPQQFYDFLASLKESEFNEQQFVNQLKEKFKLPCRELFWEQLRNKKLLLGEEKLVVVNISKLQTRDPSTDIQLSELERYKTKRSDKLIWLHEPKHSHTFDSAEENYPTSTDVIYKMEQLTTFVGTYKYKFLVEEGIIYETCCARLSLEQKNVEFDQFDSISQKDFNKLGVTLSIASNILCELEEKNILKKNLSVEHKYLLSVDSDVIPTIELSRHKLYEADVKALLQVCFSFRIALEKLNPPSEVAQGFCNLMLHHNPYLQIVDEMKEQNIINSYQVDSELEITEELVKNMYAIEINKSDYVKLLSKVYGKSESLRIVQNLIKSGWLESSKQQKYSVNTMNRKNLDSTFLNETDTISLILSHYKTTAETVSKNSKTIVNRILSCKMSSSSTVQKPNFTLKPLIEVVEEQHLSSNECLRFSLNSCDQVINLNDTKWTMNKALIFVVGCLQTGISFASLFNLLSQDMRELTSFGIANSLCFMLSALSNHCNDRIRNKLETLFKAMLVLFPTILNIAKSTFGRKLWVFLNGVNNTATKSSRPVVETIVKTVAVHSINAKVAAIASVTVENVIETQLEKLERLIIDTIYSEIDQSVDGHPVLSVVKRICLTFDKQHSKKLIYEMFSKSFDKHKSKVEQSFKEIADSIKCPMLKETLKFFQHNMKSTEDKLAYCVNLGSLLNNLFEVFLQNKKHYFQHFDIVKDVLNELEGCLQNALDVANKPFWEMHNGTIFSYRSNLTVADELKSRLKSLFSVELRENIVSPVLHSTASALLSHSFKILSDKFDCKFSKEEFKALKKFQKKCLQTVEKQNTSKSLTQEFSMVNNYDKFLLEFFNRTKKSQIFLELLHRNANVDENYIEQFCSLMPAVLRKAGIDLPGLQVIVDRNGEKKSYLSNERKVLSTPVIYITPDYDLTINLKKNTFAIGEVLKAVITQLIPLSSVVSFTVDVLQTLIVKAVEGEQGIQYLLKSSDHDNSNYQANKINTLAERATPYENSTFENHWTFSQTADIDMREDRMFYSLSDIENHIKEGFRTSLKKVNFIVQKHLKHPPKFELSDFEVTNYKIIPNTNHSAMTNFHCYPTSYNLVVPLPVSDSTLVDFEVTMNLKNTSEKTRGPCGPHIVYELKPKNSIKHWNKCCKGHVLLNSECHQQKSHEMKDCHVAGELILPTFKSITCKVVILCDSLENIYEHTSGLNCASKSYRSINSLRSNLTTLSKQYEGVKFVILYIGTDLVSKRLPEQEIVNIIVETAFEVQEKIKKAKVVLCGILLRESPAMSCNTKIQEINKELQNLCGKNNMYYLETNNSFNKYFPGLNKKANFPGVRYCKGDGVHLNKRGYQKLGKCLSTLGLKVAKEPSHEPAQTGNLNLKEFTLFNGAVVCKEVPL